MLVTTTIFIIVTVLFLWMVRTVIIATILGIVVAVYTRPIYKRVEPRFGRTVAATVTIFGVIIPVIALLVYSYIEIREVAQYVSLHQDDIAHKIDLAVRKLPFMTNANIGDSIRGYVIAASNYGTRIPGAIKAAMSGFAISATIFVFTAYYVLVDAKEISGYFRSKVPPRYSELAASLESNVRGVLYGAVYSTFVTQTLKSVILLVLFLAFRVPLAGVLSIMAFIIGFFPIVGSWSVYLPVGLWLLVFRESRLQALTLIVIGFVVNTIYISTYLRPKIAAEKSKVLNFYWMLAGLITGVYTFGLVGVLLGPIVIGLLKAIVDTVSATTWRLLDDEEVPPRPADNPA